MKEGKGGVSPFVAFYGRKADFKLDVGVAFGTYQVFNRIAPMTWVHGPSAAYILNRSMTELGHLFMRLDNDCVIAAA